MEPATEPEVVLEDVADRQPAGAEVHQLHAGLHDVGVRVLEALVHPLHDRRMHVILGVEHAGDLTAAMGEGGVQRSRLALRPARVDHNAHAVGMASGDALRHLSCLGVVASHDDQHFEVRVIDRG
jgi:hypothetical protein